MCHTLKAQKSALSDRAQKEIEAKIRAQKELDEYVEASLMDFLNLHNGLFCVNESNSDDVELTLEPPVIESEPLLIFDNAMTMLPVIYPFGTINFIFEVNN